MLSVVLCATLFQRYSPTFIKLMQSTFIVNRSTFILPKVSSTYLAK